MNSFSSSLRTGLGCAAALLAFSLSPLSGATIVNWGNSSDMVDNFRAVAGEGVDALGFAQFAQPTTADYQAYADTPGVTADFYASAFYTSSETTGPQAISLSMGNGTPDDLRSNVNEPGATQTDNHFIMFWQDAQFLTGDRELESISVTTTINTGTTTNLYYVIRLGSNYYRSSAAAAPGSVSLSDPSSTSWFDYDPTTDFSDLSGGSVSLGSFDNLTGVGFYGLNTFISTNAATNQLRTVSFEATAIPEPATAALLLGLGLSGLVMVRRRER